jgi:TPR repeat protein
MPTIEELRSWSAEELAKQLSGPRGDMAEILRVGAEAGLPDAQALYGQLLLDGDGIDRSEAEALRWFTAAAKSGHVMAMNMIGRCCENGWGTHRDTKLAAQWYQSAADLGLDWAMYNLATLYCLGEGVPEDRELALALYRKAAGLGHIKSLSMIGGFFEDGWTVEPSIQTAAEYYRLGAEGGDFRAQFNHARMLAGAGDFSGAERWLSVMTQTATPAFVAKATRWLEANPSVDVRRLAAALRAG